MAGGKSLTSARERLDRSWANFVVGTGLPYTYAEYLTLSRRQRAYVIEEANRLNKRR